MSLEKLAIKIANNRANHRIVCSSIKRILESGQDIDLSETRDYYYYVYGDWDGWMEAIKLGESKNRREFSPLEVEFARLLDEKKRLRVEYGSLKRSVCAAGRRLANASNQEG